MTIKNPDNTLLNSVISVKGARVNNLKNMSVDIPHNKFVVITGLSGSGKSSLVFDTIYAEGQRRYIESLSSYARQFLERINKPDVDSITGLAPSMAIERRSPSRNPRSTVGTSTELYDYFRLLFARAGKTYSPISGKEVKRNNTEDVLNFMYSLKNRSRVYITFPIHIHETKSVKDELENLKQKGFTRIFYDAKLIELNSKLETKHIRRENIKVVVDRMLLDKKETGFDQRISDSTEQAFTEGDGYMSVLYDQSGGEKFREAHFNKHLEADGIRFEEPEPLMFSFNNPIGACPKCQGFGETIDLNPDLIVPDKSKTIFNNAIHPFSTPKHSKHLSDLIAISKSHNIRVNIPFRELTKEEINIVYKGAGEYIGINKFFRMVEREAAYKIHYRVLLSRYRAYTTCSVCGGSRLRKEALYVKFHDKTIDDLVRSNIEQLYEFFINVKLDENEQKIAGRILEEINNRLKYLYEVGLGYITLNRLTSTLSGGETQRINLATCLGSSLVGSIYVIDEPSIGLHPRDNDRLIKILKSLRDIGNTIIVVEHDLDIMRASDHIIDIGPKAGEYGGELMFSLPIDEITKKTKKSGNNFKISGSFTSKYLSNKLKIETPSKRRSLNNHYIVITGAGENNLKNIDVEIPLGVFVCITGVSGSGKSTLVTDILYGALKKKLEGIYNEKIGLHNDIKGYQFLSAVELVDQSPIGKSPRSNPATYIKLFDHIRELFGSLPGAKLKGFIPGNFSFNIPGGRCETCEGSGMIKIAMQFIADIYLECEVCKGKRYKEDILDVRYKDKNISDVLNMSVSEALVFFKGHTKITSKLKILDDVGLGYLKLGQPGTTLSGGEAQRIKLAYHLTFQTETGKTLFIFDEPTTGLHLHDIAKLLLSFNELLKKGNSIIVVEHNLEVVKCADYIIDLGPDSGDKGGEVVATGTPEQIARNKNSYTGKFLKKVL